MGADAMCSASVHTALLSTISTSAVANPMKPPSNAPTVVVPRHSTDITSTGKLQLAATENASPTMNATFSFSNR